MEKVSLNLTITKAPKISLAFFKHYLFFFFAFFAISTQSFSQTTVIYNTTGYKTFTIPCGVTKITVEAWGAGGAGAGSANNNSRGGSGGAGGTYVKSLLDVNSGSTYNLYVAPTNNGGAYNGNKGEGSWFQSTTTLFAEGGNGGVATNGNTNTAGGTGSFTSSFGTLKIAGTNGNEGTSENGGAGGNGANGGGQGGASTNSNGGNGKDGTAIGGGGGGAYVNSQTDRLGGNGARGEIRITYEIHTLNIITTTTPSSSNLCENSIKLESTGTSTKWSPINGLFKDNSFTLPYLGETLSTVYAKPSATTSYTATNTYSPGCTSTASYEVKNYNKTFTGNGEWNEPANWSPYGVPTSENCVTIASGKIATINSGNNAMAKTVTITNTAKLIIKSNKNLNVTNEIINNSGAQNFEIENNASLIQVDNVVNTGEVTYKRTAAGIKGSDYVYWSSPVNNQAISTIYTTPALGPKYEWNTLINNGNGTGGNISQGNWVSPTATMATGKGYIIRGSSSFGMAATNLNSSFTGRPNNGNIGVTVNRGTYKGADYNGANGTLITSLDDNHNLIGNPYPSAINALRFIYDNSLVIKGTIKLWKHGIDPGLNNGGTITNPFYGNYSYNYSASDYMVMTYTGSTVPKASSSIKAGQAFFVEMQDGPEGSETVFFNNVQRRDSAGTPYANDNFFKNANQENDDLDNLERHRIWLDILDSNNTSERALVGYIEGATMDDDNNYDAIADPLTMGIYSLINNKPFIIQGRSLPFDDNDQVAIGFNVPNPGTYKIAINTADGLFLGTQDVYLKDEVLNIYHDLKTTPYTFTATAGNHDNRFKLVYKTASVLSNVTFNENEIQIAKNKNIIDIVSGNETMENVKIFDIRGRLIVEKTNINSNSISIDMNNVQDQVLIVNILTTEGIKVTKKIL